MPDFVKRLSKNHAIFLIFVKTHNYFSCFWVILQSGSPKRRLEKKKLHSAPQGTTLAPR